MDKEGFGDAGLAPPWQDLWERDAVKGLSTTGQRSLPQPIACSLSKVLKIAHVCDSQIWIIPVCFMLALREEGD